MSNEFKGAAQITIGEGANAIVINRDQQMSDLVIEPMLTTSPVNNLSSSDPVGYIQTAVSAKVTLSISDMALKNQIFALCCKSNVVTDGSKRKVVAYDQAGTKSVGRKMVVKPYDGLLPSSDANGWFTIHNAVITDLSGSSLAYSLQTQQEIKISFMATPDVTDGKKWTAGDETAVG